MTQLVPVSPPSRMAYMDLRNNLLLNEIPSPFRPLLEDDRNGLLVNNRAE